MKQMKIAMVTLVIAFQCSSFAGTLLDERPCSAWAIEGEVLSVVGDDGILVMCGRNTKIGLQKPNPGDVVFVHGSFPSSADGDRVNIQACEDGRFHYVAASGAEKTVRAFSVRQ